MIEFVYAQYLYTNITECPSLHTFTIRDCIERVPYENGGKYKIVTDTMVLQVRSCL